MRDEDVIRETLGNFVKNTAPLGLEYIRVEATKALTTIYGADGIDKTIFMKGTTKKPVKNLDGTFAIGSLPLFLNLTNDSEFKADGSSAFMVKEEVKIFKKIDPSDDDSETVEEIEERPSMIVFKDAHGQVVNFRLSNPSMAPKAQLKNEPKWTVQFEMSFSDPKLALFRSRASQFKSVEDKFRAQVVQSETDPSVSFLKFMIGQDGGHYTEVNVYKFETSKKFDVGAHSWLLDKVLNVLSFAKDCDSFTLSIAKDSGLMKISFVQYLGTKIDSQGALCKDSDGDLDCDNKITYEFIVPGKIVD